MAALGTSTATAQTELYFATGVDSTGWAQAQSNADGHVLIESPQYPRGLWLHLVDEAGQPLADIQVEYQGRPDSLAAIRCVDPVGGVRETLVWTRPEGDPLRLTLKPRETADLPAGLVSIDWQIAPTAASLLGPTEETRLEGWEAMAAFLRVRWQGQAGRVPVQINASTALAVEVDHTEAVETLVAHLQQMYQPAETPLGESAALDVQVFRGGFALQEGVILYLPLFADANLERVVWEALGRPHGRRTLEAIASLTLISAKDKSISSLVGLENCTALKHLFLGYNQIADVKPLANLTNLIQLYLDDNQIADVELLANFNNLQTLNLRNNQITNVEPLAGLTNLQWLWLDHNQIEDLAPLVSNLGLSEGDKVYLTGNPLRDKALTEQIPALRARGVSVSY